MSRLSLSRPWLAFDLGGEMQVLSWAINRPGFVTARRILWREVRNADLPVDLDVDAWLAAELARQQATDAVTFLTSRDVGTFVERIHAAGDTQAQAVATVGLSNAERIGHRLDGSAQDLGTINIAVRLEAPLTQAAMLEAMSLAASARTAAVMEAGLSLPTGIATGTGTDCIAIACPGGDQRYAGMHTDIGEAVGRAVYDAVRSGAGDWLASVPG